MMYLKPSYQATDSTLVCRLKTGNGDLVETAMPASVALEMVNRATKIEEGTEKGFEIVVNGNWYFPKVPFTETAPKGSHAGRPTKGELLEQMGEEMTNPELYDALQEAKESHGKPAKPRGRKVKSDSEA